MKRWAIREKGGKRRWVSGREGSYGFTSSVHRIHVFTSRSEAYTRVAPGEMVVPVEVTIKEWKQ